jgi:hypothetical protein
MLNHVFRRTPRSHAVIIGTDDLQADRMHLLLRINGYTPLDLLTHELGDPARVEALALELLAAGLIVDVTEAPTAPVSAWGALDELVPA